MELIVDGQDGAGVERAQGLLDRFLANRGDRTLQAYRIDIEDFGRFLGATPPGAVARLLANGPGAGRHLALEYAIDLRQRGRAQATVNRRLATLRALSAVATANPMLQSGCTTIDPPTAETPVGPSGGAASAPAVEASSRDALKTG